LVVARHLKWWVVSQQPTTNFAETTMIKLALASFLALTSGTALAQTAAPQPAQTVIEPGAPLRLTGWYLAPTAAFTTINGHLGYLPGLRGAFMLNNRLGVGLAVNFMATEHTYLGDHNARQVGAYGGAYAQYVFRSGQLVHAYADATVGSGGWCQQSVGDDCDGRKFVFLEPTLNVEVNLTRNVRLATGVGYRLAVAEKNLASESRRDMAGIVARTSIVVGVF
jgi:hypothetical protein